VIEALAAEAGLYGKILVFKADSMTTFFIKLEADGATTHYKMANKGDQTWTIAAYATSNEALRPQQGCNVGTKLARLLRKVERSEPQVETSFFDGGVEGPEQEESKE